MNTYTNLFNYTPSVSHRVMSSSVLSSIGSSFLYPLFISISLDLLRSKAVAYSGRTSTTHIGFHSISQPQSVISRASKHDIGVDCHILATSSARNMWYFSTVTVVNKEVWWSSLLRQSFTEHFAFHFIGWRTAETKYIAYKLFFDSNISCRIFHNKSNS